MTAVAAAVAPAVRLPGGLPVLGHLRSLRGDPLRFLVGAMRDHGDVTRFRLGFLDAFLVASPEGVRHVFAETNKRYDKQTRGFDKLRLVIGNGLVTSEGDFWLRQRRIAQPAFHRERLAELSRAMGRAAGDLAEAWAPRAKAGEVVDVAREMMRVTLRIVGETLLGADFTGDADAAGAALTELLEQTNERIVALLDLPLRVPTPKNRRFLRARRVLDGIVDRTIAARRRGADAGKRDLLDMLMNATDADTGEHMSDAQLRDEVLTVFGAGHETTANALAWTFYLLSTSPDVDRRVAEEAARVLGGRDATLEDLPKLAFTTMALKEALRLYPPAWIAGRRALMDDEVDGRPVPKGALVFVSPYVTHRHPELWESPEGFDPDRFTPEREAARPKFAFFPFGGGPRVCIGNSFAMMEAQLLLATLAQRYRLELVPGRRVEPEPLVTLRPRGGLPMRLVERERSGRALG